MKIQKVNIQNFVSFAEKCLSIAGGIYFEIDIPNNKVRVSAHDDRKEYILFIDKEINYFFENLREIKGLDHPIKIGLKSDTLSNLLSLISKSNELKLTIETHDKDHNDLAKLVRFYNSNFRVTKKCTHPSLPFKLIPPHILDSVLDKEDKIFEFTLPQQYIKTLKKDFFSLDDPGVTTVNFICMGEKIYFSDEDSWEYNLDSNLYDKTSKKEYKFKFFKRYFDYLDGNSYKVEVCDEKIFFTEIESDFCLIFARAL